MKFSSFTLLCFFAAFLFAGCQTGQPTTADHDDEHDHGENTVHLTSLQAQALELKYVHVRDREIGGSINTRGRLHLNPQHEATVTSLVGARVQSVRVHEGQQVSAGTILAYISHPDLIEKQTRYRTMLQEIEVLESEYRRQETLFNEQVGAGRSFQEARAKFESMKSMLDGARAELELLDISPDAVASGEVSSQIPVRSPIAGFVQNIRIRTGEFVQPESPMFEIIDIRHLHADLVIYEKDLHLIKEGQRVRIASEAHTDGEIWTSIERISKRFDETTKSLHVHAAIPNTDSRFLPGMYVEGSIFAEENLLPSLPASAIIREGDKYFVFMKVEAHDHDHADDHSGHDHGETDDHSHDDHDHDHGEDDHDHDHNHAENDGHNHDSGDHSHEGHDHSESAANTGHKHVHDASEETGELTFEAMEVIPGVTNGSFTYVRFLQPIPKDAHFVAANVYYLMAEMKKGEAGHGHDH